MLLGEAPPAAGAGAEGVEAGVEGAPGVGATPKDEEPAGEGVCPKVGVTTRAPGLAPAEEVGCAAAPGAWGAGGCAGPAERLPGGAEPASEGQTRKATTPATARAPTIRAR